MLPGVGDRRDVPSRAARAALTSYLSVPPLLLPGRPTMGRPGSLYDASRGLIMLFPIRRNTA